MSVDKQEVPQMSLLDQLKMQRAQFSAQKELAQNNLNQLVGAIFACDEMIKKHEEDAKKQEVSDQGDQGNGEAHEQGTEQAPQE
jgi:hypothetical protein